MTASSSLSARFIAAENRTIINALHASAAVGVAIQYDFTKIWHVVGSVNRGIENTHDADQFSFNLALKWTP